MGEPWPLVPLGEVLVKNSETTAIYPDRTYQEVTVRMWGNGVVLRRMATGAEIAADRRAVVHTGEFILSRIDARNGAFGIVPESLDAAVVSNDFPSFHPLEGRLDTNYLGWLSKTASFVELCRRASEGSTNRVRLKEELFLRMPILLPPIEEQRRIVARVEAITAKVEEAERLRMNAVREAAALVQAARRSAFERFQFSEPLVTACTAIIDNLHSNPVYSPQGVPCVRSSDVGWGFLDLLNARKTSEEEYRRRTARGEPAPDDIVFVREGGGTGKAALVKEGQRFSLGQRVMMIRPDREKVIPEFLLQQILSPGIQELQMAPLITGSAAPHLNIGDLKEFLIAVPSLEEQMKTLQHLQKVLAHADGLAVAQRRAEVELNALLPSVLDRAFRGEL